MKKVIAWMLFLVLLVCPVFASTFTPQGDIWLRDTYEVNNATQVITTNLTADNLEGHLDGTGYNITAAYFIGTLVGGGGTSTFANLTVTDIADITNLKATNLEKNLDATGRKERSVVITLRP